MTSTVHQRRPSGCHGRLVSIAVLVFVAVAAGCGDDGTPDRPSETTTRLANPASVYCEDQGGEVDIVDEADGQVGYCRLPDGRRVDEWEFYRSNTTQP